MPSITKRIQEIIRLNNGKKVESPISGKLIQVGGAVWLGLVTEHNYVPHVDGSFTSKKKSTKIVDTTRTESFSLGKGAKRINKLDRNFSSAKMGSAERIHMKQTEIMEKEERNRLQEIANQMAEEEKQLRKEKAPPRLSTLPANKIRINDTLVIRTTTRLIKVIERIQITWVKNPQVQDPIFILSKAEGEISRGDQAKLTAALLELSKGQYKRDGRLSRFIRFRSVDIVYQPLEKDTIDFSISRLTHLWAVKGPIEFIQQTTALLEGAKHVSYGYDKTDYNRVTKFLAEVEKIKPEEENTTVQEDQIKNLFLEFINNYEILIPENFEIFQVAPITTDAENSQTIKSYIDLVHLANSQGIDEFPELKERILEQIQILKDKIDTENIITDIEELVFFEDFDYKPLPLEEKELVTKVWERAVKNERLTRLETLRIEHAPIREGAQLAVYDITDVPVPESLRKIVVQEFNREHLDGNALEEIFYNRFSDSIREYIYAVANITSKLKLDPEIKLRERIINGDINDILNPTKEQLLPELYLNRKLTSSKRELGRLDRLLNDFTSDEANLLLYNWQPAVKKQWFPVSIALNPLRLTWKEYIISDITGGSCGDDMIYIRTQSGDIRCLNRQYIIDNIGDFIKYNNRSDLAMWLNVDVPTITYNDVFGSDSE